MGIYKRWSRITSWNINQIPDEPGAYEIADRYKQTIDIGGSENLAERIPRKLADRKFNGRAAYFRFEEDYDPWTLEAELQAQYMAKHGQKPPYTGRVQGEAYDILEDWWRG